MFVGIIRYVPGRITARKDLIRASGSKSLDNVVRFLYSIAAPTAAIRLNSQHKSDDKTWGIGRQRKEGKHICCKN